MKQCACCLQSFPLDNFQKNAQKADGLSSYCKSCDQKKWRATRNKRKEHYNDIAKQRSVENSKILTERRSAQGCVLCPEKTLSCLDFHHLDPSVKEDDVSLLTHSRRKLEEEIAKCVVLCRNCHAKIHAGRVVQSELLQKYLKENYV